MSNLKRMPHHRVIYLSSHVQGWSTDYRLRVANLSTALTNYKNSLSSNLVKPHKTLEVGGHKASQIKSYITSNIKTAEDFCSEIRAARGEFGSLHERLSNLTGSGFIKSWASAAEFNSTESKENIRVNNNRLECAEEPQPHQDIYGLDNINYINPGAGSYDELVKADDLRPLTATNSNFYSGYYQFYSAGFYNYYTTSYANDPKSPNEKIFSVSGVGGNYGDVLSGSLNYVFKQQQNSSESFFCYMNIIPTVNNTNLCYIQVNDGNKIIYIYLNSSGISVDGVLYNYSSFVNTGLSWLNEKHNITVVKFKNYFWEISVDGVVFLKKSYSDKGGQIEGTFNTVTPSISFIAGAQYGVGWGQFYVKEIGVTQFSSTASLYDNIKFNENNTITVTPGKLNGSYMSKIKSIYRDRGSLAKKLSNEYSGPSPRSYIRFGNSESLLKNESWLPVDPSGNLIGKSYKTKPFYQYKLELSGSGSVSNSGSALLLENTKDYKVSSICKNGTAISDRSSNTSSAEIPFSNSADDLSTYWSSSQVYTSAINGWIGYNFGTSKQVSVKTIILSQRYFNYNGTTGWNWISSVKIQKSNNGTTWEDVQTVGIKADSSIQLINVIDSAPAQYWRLKANSNTSRGSASMGWEVSLIQMFDERFVLSEINDYVNISDKISFQGNVLSGVPNGDFSNGTTGWICESEVSNPLDPEKVAAWTRNTAGYTWAVSATVRTPSFILNGPIEFIYKVENSSNNNNTKVMIYESATNQLLYEDRLTNSTQWSVSKLNPPKNILNKNVYISFFKQSDTGNPNNTTTGLVAAVGVGYIKLLNGQYISVPKKIEGNKIKKVKWKQKVGSGEHIVDKLFYPRILLKTGTTESSTTVATENFLPSQETLSGVWTDCSVDVEQLGEYVALGAFFGKPDAHDHLIELDSFEIEWEKISVTDATTVTKTTLDYESYLYYENGEAYYRFDSNDKSTKWGRFMAEGGFEATANNANTKWEKRVLKNVTDAYIGIDAFSKSMVELVTSPNANSNFPVSGNGTNAAYLFTTYLYNGTSLDISLNIPVSSSGSNNIWEVFKNRQSLGLKKSSYTIAIAAGAWARVDLYFKRVGSSPETFYTNINWPASVSIMNSTQNMNPDPDMFAMRVSDTWPIPDSEPWIPTGNNTAIDLQGRYFNVRVKTRASTDRMKSTGTSFFAVSYTGDASSKVVTNIASLAENLARTNFELKVLTQADSKNLLHIFQDVFENQSDISTYSSNIVRDSALPGIKQINDSQPGILISTMFENNYYPTFAMVVSDGIGEIEYFVSRDNGVTFSSMKPSTLTEFSGKLGKQIVFKAILKNGAVLKRWAVIL